MTKIDGVPLIDAIRLKRQDSFQYLYDHCWKVVSQYILDQGGNSQVAREIFHASIMKLYELIGTNKIQNKDELDLIPLLNQIAHFKWHMHSDPDRIIEFLKQESNKDEKLNVLYEILQQDTDFRLQPRLHQLNMTCQKILQLYFWDELSIKQIAIQLNLSEEEVVSRKDDCLARMN